MVGMDDTEPISLWTLMGKLPKGVIITVVGEARIPWALALGSVKSVCLSLRMHLEAECEFGENNSYNLREFNKKKTVLFIELSDKDVTSNWIAKCIISQLVRLQIKDKENNEPVKNVLIVLNDAILDDFSELPLS